MATNTSHEVFFAQIENVSLCECWTWLWRRLVVGWTISSTESYRLKQQRALYMIASSEQQMAPLLINTSYRICIFLFLVGNVFEALPSSGDQTSSNMKTLLLEKVEES